MHKRLKSLSVYSDRDLPRIAENFGKVYLAVLVGGGGYNALCACGIYGYRAAVIICRKRARGRYEVIFAVIEEKFVCNRRFVGQLDFEPVAKSAAKIAEALKEAEAEENAEAEAENAESSVAADAGEVENADDAKAEDVAPASDPE